MNNYEKIKSMSVDELAKLFANEGCRVCKYRIIDCITEDKDCEEGIKQWLLQEEV